VCKGKGGKKQGEGGKKGKEGMEKGREERERKGDTRHTNPNLHPALLCIHVYSCAELRMRLHTNELSLMVSSDGLLELQVSLLLLSGGQRLLLYTAFTQYHHNRHVMP